MGFQADTSYMNNVLSMRYHFDEVLYLHPNATTGQCLNKTIVRWAIRDWLGARSNADDLIFIFIFSHGNGVTYYNETLSMLEGGRWELDSDEGDEFSESVLISGEYDYWYQQVRINCPCGACYPITMQYCPTCGRETVFGIDFDGDGIIEPDVYAGVDECLKIETNDDVWPPEYDNYWDDEMKEDLDTLDYGKMVVLLEACRVVNETGACFSGGFIRDLSTPNRIIITSSNETSSSWARPIDTIPSPPKGFRAEGYFSRPFIQALAFPVIADVDFNGLVSIGEAWQFAWLFDEARYGLWVPSWDGGGMWVTETPWIDDDGDGIPNPIPNELVDELAFDTFFLDELSVCDINNDGFITIQDIVIMATHFGEESECPEWDVWSDRCDLNDDGIIDIVDIVLLAEHYGEAAH